MPVGVVGAAPRLCELFAAADDDGETGVPPGVCSSLRELPRPNKERVCRFTLSMASLIFACSEAQTS